MNTNSSLTETKEIRDSTGNILRPGMYGYEDALVKSEAKGQSSLPRCEAAPSLSKNVARSLRHKLNMVWMCDHKGDGWYDGKSAERDHEVTYVYNAIVETYASKNYAGALWLDRELKLKQAYEIAVERTPLGQAMPARPLLYTLFDQAACYATNPLPQI